MRPPRPFYEQIAHGARTRADRLRRRYDRLALLRLLVFAVWIAGLMLVFTTHALLGFLTFCLTVPLLAYGVRRHLALQRGADEARTLADLAEGELRALDHDYAHYEDGHDWLDPAHPYALDLDVFGPASLFQYLNRTVSAPGRRELARALLNEHSREEVARTQVQGKALGVVPVWCLRWRVLGHGLDDTPTTEEGLLDWLRQPPVAPTDATRYLLYLAPLLTLASLAWMLLASPWQLGLLGLLPAGWLLRRYRTVIATEHARTAAVDDLLRKYADLLEHNQSRPGGVGELPGDPARSLRRLAYLTAQLDVRYNVFAFLLEIGGLWSLNQFRRLDAWRAEHQHHLPRWLRELARTDAYVSWATLRFNHPDWPDPTFGDEPRVEAAGLGHPLLPATQRVTNDFSLRTDGHIHLVTGSNMAGKSTWLRTVGVNVVLAKAGGPVCATGGAGRSPLAPSSPTLHLRPAPETSASPSFFRLPFDLEVWTSMHTQDDLSTSTSSFYAELKRLKAIIGAVAQPDRRVLFLLDEILKGTNSRDRHTGSRALIRQLIRDRGAGIIATHDLDLAALERAPGSRVENYAMEVQVKDGQLTFDYKLRPGVCESFNATALMARMGIDIPEEEIRLRH